MIWPTFQGSWSLCYNPTQTAQDTNMSFQTLSERLTALQESNAQLQELINRLATIKFQPGSIPLDNEEGNVMTELSSEIQQTLKDQDEDLELLQEDVYDLDSGRKGSELDLQKDKLDQAVKRAIKELKGQASFFFYWSNIQVMIEAEILSDVKQPSAKLS
jgi:replicative DNA helicase